MSRNKKTNHEGWHHNTALGCDLKTILRSDSRMKSGKDYQGVLRRDIECEDFRFDEHYTFVETVRTKKKQNPHVFVGQYLTITRREDGTLRPNFRPIVMDDDFTVERYAFGVYRELHKALDGLVER